MGLSPQVLLAAPALLSLSLVIEQAVGDSLCLVCQVTDLGLSEDQEDCHLGSVSCQVYGVSNSDTESFFVKIFCF